MAKSRKDTQFVVLKAKDGSFRWRLLDSHGNEIAFDPGTAPGLRRKKGYAEVRRAVQAALAQRYSEQQQSA